MSKAARPGKVFVDYLRNGRGATAIVPYSPRARANAPVSVPLTWEELNGRRRGDYFTLRNVMERLAKLRSDPWKAMKGMKQSLKGSIAKVKSLASG
jgi:bifunctional non-homologous end joining protein LigD